MSQSRFNPNTSPDAQTILDECVQDAYSVQMARRWAWTVAEYGVEDFVLRVEIEGDVVTRFVLTDGSAFYATRSRRRAIRALQRGLDTAAGRLAGV